MDNSFRQLSIFTIKTAAIINKNSRVNWIAENTSSYSNIPLEVHYTVTTAWEAIASLVCLGFSASERHGFLRLGWIEKMANKANFYNREGKWEVVAQLCELNLLLPAYIKDVLFRHFSSQTIFGNLIPLCGRISKTCKVRKYYRHKRTRVRYPKRKRGYDDKGSLRPNHLWLPTDVHIGPNPEKKNSVREWHPRNKNFWFPGNLKIKEEDKND